jgi:type II secretory pathway component PulJ
MNHRRGFALVDMLLAISLMGVFSLLAYRLVNGNIHIAAQTALADSNALRFYGAVRVLREDVFQSTALEMPEANLLRIHGPGNTLIDWREDHDGLIRSRGRDKNDWKMDQPVNLKLDGSIVLIWANPNDQIALASNHFGASR